MWIQTYEIILIAVLAAKIANDAIIHAVGTDASVPCFFWTWLRVIDAIAAHDASMFVSIMIFLSYDQHGASNAEAGKRLTKSSSVCSSEQ